MIQDECEESCIDRWIEDYLTWEYIRMFLAVTITITMISLTTFEVLPLLASAAGAASMMVLCQVISVRSATQAVSMPIILTIGAAFSIGGALEETGVAERIANSIVDITDSLGTLGLLAGIYFSTAVLTELISNSAAVTLMFPIVSAILEDQRDTHLKPKTAMYGLMFAASSSFSTPVGYQTNMMVWEPGGYSFLDFVKFGLPLQVVCMVTSVLGCYYLFN